MNIYSPNEDPIFETLKTTTVDQSQLGPILSLGESQARYGEDNGMYGWKWGDRHPKGMLGKTHSEETKKKWSIKRKGAIPWNLGIKSPEHSEFMKTKMLGNSHVKGIKYPKCSCVVCKKEIAINTLTRHALFHN